MAPTPTNPNAPSFRYANALTDPSIHPQIKQFGASVSNALSDIYQAFPALKAQIDAVKTTVTQTVTAAGGGITPSPPNPPAFPGLGGVNNQTGVTTYLTQTNDNGALLVLGDASPIAVSLNSAMTTPYFLFITNLGVGVATLTPTTGTVNTVASITLLSGASCYVFFDGTNWEAGTAIDASKVVLLNPTGNQTVIQSPTFTFAIVAGAGATLTEFVVTDGAIEAVTPSVTFESPSQTFFAPVDASGTPGTLVFEAIASGTSGSLVQLSGSVAFFEGISLESYTIVTTDTTVDYTFGASTAPIDASSNNVTLTLPNVISVAGATPSADSMEMVVIRNDNTPVGHTVTVAATSPATIQGAASITLPDKTAVTLVLTTDPTSGALTWQIQTDNRPATGLSVTITTAVLTVGGTQGSQTFVNGLLTAQIQAT